MSARHWGTLALTLIAVGAGAVAGFAGWPQPQRTLEFCGLILAAILAARFALRSSIAGEWTVPPPSLVIELTTLLILGRDATTAVAAAAAMTRALANWPSPRAADDSRAWLAAAALDTAAAIAATQAAGFAYAALGGSLGHFSWPFQAAPIAAAVLLYCAVTSLCRDILAPLLAKQPLAGDWPQRLLHGAANHLIAGSLAAVTAEIVDRRAWEILLVAAAPLALAYRAYASHVRGLHDERRRREAASAFDQGMLVVDRRGAITLWSDSLERLLECPRAAAIGRTLAEAVPALAKTPLPGAIADGLRTRAAATFTVTLATRVLDLRTLPVPDGLTLIWTDVTERRQAALAAKQSEERLALLAEGANDGLWEWDRRTETLHISGRWNSMIGLPAVARTGRLDDWLDRVHSDDVAALRQALDAHVADQSEVLLHDHRIRHEDGSYRRFLCRGVAVRGAGRRAARIAGSLTDITEGAIAEERLRTVGVLDPLTGLSNRAEFVESLGRRLEAYKREPLAGRFAALYLDLDRFKIVNDSVGHMVGDELLKVVSRRLEACLREGDTLARLGGDEFAILLNDLAEENQANAIAFRIQKSLSAPCAIGGREVFTSASIGIAFGRAHYQSPDEIMRDADRAMYHAKARGKARHELFDADMHARTLDRIGLESDLRRAVDQNAFELHYQPIILLSTGMCVGFESLIRWTRNGEPISPVTFIPMAEELGLIERVGTWCLEQACSRFAEWKRQFPDGSLEYITVNVSSRQLVQHNFFSLVERVVVDSGVRPCDLRLEITETALMDSPAAVAGLLRELRDFGVKIYLDDFGTGYSSLSHLHKLPVDALKIDRSFVKSLGLPDRPAIVESILALARTMNTSVVAEGIETEVQAHELERLGCTHAQGFLFSRPLPQQAAAAVLAAARPLNPNKVRAA